MPEVPLSNGFYIDEAVNLSNQECLNLIPVVVETKGSLSVDALRSPAGIKEIALDEGQGPCRGTIRFNNGLFAVFGNRFYQVFEDGSRVAIGDEVKGTGRVALAENGRVIAVVVPETIYGYFYQASNNTLKEIVDQTFIDYGRKLDVTQLDGYFVYVTVKEFFISSLVIDNDGMNFYGLQYGAAEASTDDNVACAAIKGEIYIFGEFTIEVFRNTGADFPFQRINGAKVDRGLLARDSVMPFQNSYLFIGAGKNEGISIWQGGAGTSQRLSTPAIDNILQQLPIEDLRQAYSFKYAESGNYFCGFTIPNQITLVFDDTTSTKVGGPIWHRRASSADGTGVSRVSHYEQVYGKIYAFDSSDARIGLLDIDLFQEYGENILRRFNTVYFSRGGYRFQIYALELKAQFGKSTPYHGVSFPNYISLQTSSNGTDFNTEIQKLLPESPRDAQRMIWRRIGNFDYSAAFQFDVLTDRKITFTKLVVEQK